MEIDDEHRKILAKVQKLLQLSEKNPNSEEAASAAAKAQELLLAYNLSEAMLEEGGSSAKREKTLKKGGTYKYQRDLWMYVADLNFCLYWTQRKTIDFIRTRKNWDGSTYKEESFKYVWHHRLVGRSHNVQATINMSEYLQEAIERILAERLLQGKPFQHYNILTSNWAHSYRAGAVSNIVSRLWDRRREQMAEEDKRRRMEEDRLRASGFSTSNALTIAGLRDKEHDANMDALYGEGWSARQASKRAAQAAADRAADEAYTKWAAENPEEARREEEKRRKEEEKRSRRRTRSSFREDDKTDWSAYNAGHKAADSISIDQQVRAGGENKRIGSK